MKSSMNTTDLAAKLSRLRISSATINACSLPLQIEATDLTPSENDIYDRPQLMTPDTLDKWHRMQAAAAADKLPIALVSAYRSIDYQCHLIERKLAAGQAIDDILRVNSIPGYSEHHTGRALDLHDGIGEPLTTAFDQGEAFRWLCDHAYRYDFVMTYPRDNEWGMSYEPWHWCCSKG